MAYDNFLVDKRVVDRNIAKGLVDADELKRHIESLPDRESNCVHVSLDGNVAHEPPQPVTESFAAADDSGDDVDSDEEDSDEEDSDEEDSDEEDSDDEDSDDDEEDEGVESGEPGSQG